MMKGTICFGTDKDGAWLRLIGVKLWPAEDGGFHQCEMSDAVFEKLNPHWGTFFWSLERAGQAPGKEEKGK